MDSRFPDFQELHLPLEELVRMWQELWSWIFLFLNLGAVDLASRRDSNRASTATSTITGNSKTWVSARPSVQTLATLHQKWTTSCASWLLSIHLDLLTTFLVLFHQPTDLVPGFLTLVIPSPYCWRRHYSSGPLWSRRHSTIMMWPSPPLLFHSDSEQPLVVKSNCLSQVAETILSQQRPNFFLECAFHFFS